MAREVDIDGARRNECRPHGIDATIAELAGAQHGVVARWQLIDRGVSPGAVHRRARTGALHRMYHGVYAEAEDRRLSDPLPLAALLERHRGERGAGAPRRALDDVTLGRGVTRSRLEERFAAFVRRHRLRLPLLNAPITAGGWRYVADALWPEARVIVELQSVAFHSSPAAMSADADRTRRLTIAGYRVVYVTWAQLAGRSAAESLARDLQALIRPASA